MRRHDIVVFAGLPESLLSMEAQTLLREGTSPTIASQLWAENSLDYLPPECHRLFSPPPTANAVGISKIHSWIIGWLLYRMTSKLFQPEENEYKADLTNCECPETKDFIETCLLQDVQRRPTLSSLLKLPYLLPVVDISRIDLLRDEELPTTKIQSAMEAFPDMRSIVNTTLRGDERGVNVYESGLPVQSEFIEKTHVLSQLDIPEIESEEEFKNESHI
ncbi:hypothetical protein IE077_003785 [Cardiosporidium cionae]|uniref:Protein kinase domain-containing protein n=1 Tax=Cardiosporidium cionae TaxID=476202 RepID=A0ABQ7J7H4_9APIC|nr:hypothetical protein IE077_003785 [Cardiosporidium cionae]|eukprot:KAF8819936.1 hypothetical protein IE077_003785 [Cardiosporidium cionae]